jgi:hypothetical protein
MENIWTAEKAEFLNGIFAELQKKKSMIGTCQLP